MMTSILHEDLQRVASELAEVLAPLAGRTVLVTGAGGMIGSFCCDLFIAWNALGVARPCRLLAVDNFLRGVPDRIQHLRHHPDVTFLTADISRPLPPEVRPDYIVHLAGIASPAVYRAHPLATVAVNVDGTRNMLELARQSGSRSMLSFSSSEIYGDPDPAAIPTPEDYRGLVSCTGPRACYDESKRMGETLCVIYAAMGVPVKVIRPFNVFGPGQRIDDGRIIPDLMKAAIAGGPLVLFSDGRPTRSFCYLADFVEGSMRLMMSSANGESFNVGNDREISMRQVAELVARLAADPPLEIEYRVSDDSQYLIDNPQRRCPDLSKLRRVTGFTARVGLEEALARTLASYREQAATSARTPALVE